MRKGRWLARTRWLLLGCALLGTLAAQAQNDLAFQRARHLQRGVNLSMWYAQAQDYSAAQETGLIHENDFLLLRSLGFDHVRVSVNPAPLIVPGQSIGDKSGPALQLDQAAMARLNATVHSLTLLGIAVVLDAHPDEPWKKHATATADGAAQLYGFWKSFAQYFAATDPDTVYFEILNEPEGVDETVWAHEQAELAGVIRTVAPHHTIIATGANWGGIDALIQLDPLHDANVIYTFHDYEPMEFTHQGATWAGPNLIPLRNVPYPSSPEAVAPLLPKLSSDDVRLDLATYGEDRWSATQMRQRVSLAFSWAQALHVPLWCGEFGVYRPFAPAAARIRWITDMRHTLEAANIGWDMWDYQGGFALVTKKDGVPAVDAGVATALGLTP